MQVTKFVFVSVVLLHDVIYTTSANPQTRIFVKPKTKNDNLLCSDPKIKNVYDSVLNLLVHKMKTWIKSVDANSSLGSSSTISNYLGFPPETIKLIDDAFTELLYRHIKQIINIDNLATAFFYTCDLEHMRDPNANRLLNVRENFEKIFENLGIDDNYVADYRGETKLVVSLIKSLMAVGKPVDCWFRVSISLMKNRLFVGVSTGSTVNDLKGRFIGEYEEKYAEPYEKETDVNVVIKNHLEIMRKVIPDLFGISYNHIVLINELRKFEIDDLDDNDSPVLRNAGILPLVVAIFIHRYFEFKNYIRDPLKDEIRRYFEFICPIPGFSGTKGSIEYYKNKGELYNFHKLMWDTTNNALNQVLVIFGNEDAEKWKENRSMKVDVTNISNIEQILALMDKNTQYAIDFLEEISRKCGSYFDGDVDYTILRDSMFV